jgi:hypothetical protein
MISPRAAGVSFKIELKGGKQPKTLNDFLSHYFEILSKKIPNFLF